MGYQVVWKKKIKESLVDSDDGAKNVYIRNSAKKVFLLLPLAQVFGVTIVISEILYFQCLATPVKKFLIYLKKLVGHSVICTQHVIIMVNNNLRVLFDFSRQFFQSFCTFWRKMIFISLFFGRVQQRIQVSAKKDRKWLTQNSMLRPGNEQKTGLPWIIEPFYSFTHLLQATYRGYTYPMYVFETKIQYYFNCTEYTVHLSQISLIRIIMKYCKCPPCNKKSGWKSNETYASV